LVYLLVEVMGEHLVNRNDNQYTSRMETTMDVDTSIFPARWLHIDDFTVCDRHEVCDRDTFVRGGRPEHPDNLTV
jgi:hypothetical protein